MRSLKSFQVDETSVSELVRSFSSSTFRLGINNIIWNIMCTSENIFIYLLYTNKTLTMSTDISVWCVALTTILISAQETQIRFSFSMFFFSFVRWPLSLTSHFFFFFFFFFSFSLLNYNGRRCVSSTRYFLSTSLLLIFTVKPGYIALFALLHQSCNFYFKTPWVRVCFLCFFTLWFNFMSSCS